MSNLLNEAIISIHEAAGQIPGRRPGKKLSFTTLWRWIIKGIRTGDGQVIRLEAVRLGARWVTSREAIIRFSAKLTPPTDAPPATRTPASRQRGAKHSREELKRKFNM
jgi:hypothetical protein